jgi:ppGpp synthetase/RelA/SpoT-type nucleotidyltranferase
MTEAEFTLKYEQEKSLYLAWGNYILTKINSGLKSLNFQIEPKIRVKDINSLIGKAYYRNKNYTDPYNNITDKVGIRFVVLLGSEINAIHEIIKNPLNDWCFSKDRDFEQERISEPLAFDYQSMHYVLTSKSTISLNGVMIPAGITCEVQVRTLLQHAYSELSHSRVYKPDFDPDAKVKRVIAKSMALLETTDEYFEEVNRRMNEIGAYKLLDQLTELLRCTVGEPIVSTKANLYIMEAFVNELNAFFISDVKELVPLVKTNFKKTFLNSQPIIFFIYFMIMKNKAILLHKWPLTRDELRPFFIQLGISVNDLG